MAKYKLEYLWLDGYKPVPNIRGKTLIKEYASFPTLEQLPFWGFDGSKEPGRRASSMPIPLGKSFFSRFIQQV